MVGLFAFRKSSENWIDSFAFRIILVFGLGLVAPGQIIILWALEVYSSVAHGPHD